MTQKIIPVLNTPPSWSCPLNLQAKKAKDIAQIALENIKAPWRYISRGIFIIKKSLKLFVHLSKDAITFEKRAQLANPLVTKLGVPSCITVLLNTESAFSEIMDIPKNYELQDFEGLFLTVTSAVIESADTVDTLGTFLGSLEKICNFPPIQIFKDLEMPLAYFMLTFASLMSAYSISRTTHFLYTEEVLQNSPSEEAIKEFLTKKLALTEDEIQIIPLRDRDIVIEKKKKIFIRQTTALAYEQFKLLQEKLKETGKLDRSLADRVIQNTKTGSLRKIAVKTTKIAANMIMITGLLCFSLSVPSFIPWLCLTTAGVIRLANLIYEKRFQNQNLELKKELLQIP